MRAAPPLGRAVVLALVLVAAAAVLRGLVWAAALPPWQGPDEPDHYAYVERLAGGGFPPLQRGGDAATSPAAAASLDATAFDDFRDRLESRPLSAQLRSALPAEPPGLSSEGRGARGATIYPPLYYAAVLPLYSLPGLDTATARLYAVRAGSALLAAVLVVATFLLVLEATGRPRLALVGGVLVALPPLAGQASGIANPDILLAAGAAGLAWAALRLTREPRSRPAQVSGAAWLAVLVLAKPAGALLAAAILAGLVVVPAAVRSRRVAAAAVATVAAAGAALALVAAAGGARVRDPLGYAVNYLWSFYGAGPPRATGRSGASTAWTVWVESGVGGFGWHSVWLPEWMYVLALASVLAGLGAAAAGLARDRRGLPLAAGIAVAVLLYVLTLHAVEAYVLVKGGTNLLQGRYLLPVAPLATAGFLMGVARLPTSARALAIGGVAAVWAFLAFAGLDATVRYFGS